jgi:hypothetical protein
MTFTVWAASRQQARGHGDLVASVLNDAPLVFATGSAFYFRESELSVPPQPEVGPGGGVTAWGRAIVFDYRIQGSLSSVTPYP